MKTGGIDFKRAVYMQTSTNKDNTILDYTLKDGFPDVDPLFTEKIRLEKDNGFHKDSRVFTYWLYFRDDTNWKRCTRTGLANTNFKNVFEGNISRELDLTTKTEKGKNLEIAQHLVIVQSFYSQEFLIVDIFKDFYIYRKPILQVFLKDHSKVSADHLQQLENCLHKLKELKSNLQKLEDDVQRLGDERR